MAKFFINRPIVAIVISILMVIAGVVAMLSLLPRPNFRISQTRRSRCWPAIPERTRER